MTDGKSSNATRNHYGTEILDVSELAEFLRMSKSQVYELCRDRVRSRMDHPLPVLKINGNLRFSRPAIEAWLQQLQEAA